MTKVLPVAGVLPLVLKAVMIPFGVPTNLLSWIRTEPTVWFVGVFDMLTPTPQLLTVMDLSIHTQFQFMYTSRLRSQHYHIQKNI